MPGHAFDEERLLRLVALMKEHDLREVELRDADQQIRICRAPAGVGFAYAPPGGHYPAGGYLPAAPSPGAIPTPSPPAESASEPAPADTESASVVVITSPMVGTFYAKPNPNAQPYVRVGDHVDPETTICLIEAMKVFNEIPAEVSGRIVAILVDDEEPVEYGKPLFRVDTKG